MSEKIKGRSYLKGLFVLDALIITVLKLELLAYKDIPNPIIFTILVNMAAVDVLNNLIKDEEFTNKFANIIIYLFATGFFSMMFPDILAGDFHRPVNGEVVSSSPQEIQEGLSEFWGLLSLIGPINLIKFFIQQHLHTSNSNKADYRRRVKREEEYNEVIETESKDTERVLKDLETSGLSLDDMHTEEYCDISKTWVKVPIKVGVLADMGAEDFETVVTEVKVRRRNTADTRKEERNRRKKVDKEWKKEEKERKRLQKEKRQKKQEEEASFNNRWWQTMGDFNNMFGGSSNYSYSTEGNSTELSYTRLGDKPGSEKHLKKLYRAKARKYHPDKNRGKEEEVKEKFQELNEENTSWEDHFKKKHLGFKRGR